MLVPLIWGFHMSKKIPHPPQKTKNNNNNYESVLYNNDILRNVDMFQEWH